MEKIQKYAYKTMLAMKNPLKSVDRVYPLAFDEISNHDGRKIESMFVLSAYSRSI